MCSRTYVSSYIGVVHRQSLLTNLALVFFPLGTERGCVIISDYIFQEDPSTSR